MWQIAQNLFLGQDSDARNLGALRAAGITHIVNCAAELACYHPAEFKYLHLALKDPDSLFGSKISPACEFLDEATRTGAGLVHCQGAISRGPAVVLAYLCHRGHALECAVETLARIVETKPNEVFLQVLSARFTASHVCGHRTK